jgi:branched-chain amino acid transport system substrate-binding protein
MHPSWRLLGTLGITLLIAAPVRADILIGAAGPMTGSMAWFGEQMQEGIGMKVAELNAAGGVLGRLKDL